MWRSGREISKRAFGVCVDIFLFRLGECPRCQAELVEIEAGPVGKDEAGVEIVFLNSKGEESLPKYSIPKRISPD
jgi:hypothetical protein